MAADLDQESRLAHPRRWLLLLSMCLALTAGGFAAGRLTGPPSEGKEHEVSAGPVFATAEERRIGNTATVSGSFVSAVSIAIPPFKPAGATHIVVDRVLSKPGQPTGCGSALLVLSGRPLIALPLAVPLSRSISYGDTGPDVRKLQEALASCGLLSGPVDDTFGPRLQVAVQRLYAKNSFPAPSSAGVKAPAQGAGPGSLVVLDEIVGVPLGSEVRSVPAVGTILDTVETAMTVSTGSGRVLARVPVDLKDVFAPGSAVLVHRLDGSGSTGTAKVVAISGFRPETGGASVPGYDVTIRLTRGTGMQSGTKVGVVLDSDEGLRRLAVPSAAVREDDDGTFVLRRASQEVVRTAVSVAEESGGWTAVSGGGITVGSEVQVFP